MLTQAGIQFKRHEEEGVELSDFAELLTSSGLVLSEEISWITFARYILYYTYNFIFIILCTYSILKSQILF